MTTAVEKTKPSQSPPPPPTSFSSLPHDVVLNCLARVSRSYSPILFLVSKSFRTLMTSPELHATRTLIGKTEDCLYVCLDLDNNNPNPRWFTLSQIPEQQKLIPISLTHYKVHIGFFIGSAIYMIGGFHKRKGKRNSNVSILDCGTVVDSLNCVYLEEPEVYTDVVHGNIYVVGGSRAIKDCGEIYNPKIQTWEPLSPSVDLWIEKVCPLEYLHIEGDKNVRHIISVENGKLVWCNDGWSLVRVLEGLSSNSCFPNNLVSVASLGRGGRVAVWWKKVELGRQGRHYTNQCKTDIWCAEISFEMRPCLLPPGLQLDELWGVVEWSKSVFTFDGCDSGYDFFLHSAIVTL
ncbi:LOW QUALITY PROTEIN: hypothetical protein BRARA_H02153 [Brassica rapa]|uniref:F-box domain-containing protein n=1 Tax=Brassica campestris TaxID=3711 RepID=A0A397YL89_BRACM|nr:LOW QUALITY PROTEIN: hypothetical protein BRARA_H02153 [Brassica rapa]